MKKSKNFGLDTVNKGLALKHTDLLATIQKEIIAEEQAALQDFIKGAYRLKIEKEKEIERLNDEVEKIDSAIADAGKGNWEKMEEIRIPARYFNEATLRKHSKSLLSGNDEIRFLDLYESGK